MTICCSAEVPSEEEQILPETCTVLIHDSNWMLVGNHGEQKYTCNNWCSADQCLVCDTGIRSWYQMDKRSCLLVKSHLEPLHSQWTGALPLAFIMRMSIFFGFGREDIKYILDIILLTKQSIYGMSPSQTYIPVTGRLDIGKLCLSFFSKIFNKFSCPVGY